MTSAITVVPANLADWGEVEKVFGTRGPASWCWCQRYKLRPRESFGSFPAEERAHRLREQIDPGDPAAERTAGLLARLDGEPVGWCAVEPRPAYHGMVRNQKVPWQGRDEDPEDPGVWAVTCFVTRAGYRKRGVATALLHAAVGHARGHGAHALEGYPITTTKVILEELHVGTVGMFEAAGFREVSHPTLRRVVMRLDL
ncbi:MAG TPA: GNAT family N-acetyltransferase [Ornithinicoccus sp.]|jgi:GNAT superfamily N-acetyltransferase|nr:GNAT family N-acetyltransferase [Ornithinicoccus sp.]